MKPAVPYPRSAIGARIAGLCAAVLAGATASVQACPFCGPPPDSPGVSMAAADATVVADAVSRRLFFAGDAEAKVAVNFRTVRVIRGAGPAPDQTFQLIFPAAPLAPPPGRAVVTLQRAGRGYAVLGAYADPQGVVAEYLTALAALPAGDAAARLDFLPARLEHADERIAADVHGQFASVPLAELERRRDRLSADKLRQWLLSDKVPSPRKGLYAIMLSLVAAPTDAELLDKALPKADDSAVGSGGILAARVRLGGKPADVLLPIIRDENRSFACREGAVRAAGFLWESGPAEQREALRSVFRAALADRLLLPYAVDELVRVKEPGFVDEIKAAWLGPGRMFDNVRRYVRKYAESLPAAQRARVEAFLEGKP